MFLSTIKMFCLPPSHELRENAGAYQIAGPRSSTAHHHPLSQICFHSWYATRRVQLCSHEPESDMERKATLVFQKSNESD